MNLLSNLGRIFQIPGGWCTRALHRIQPPPVAARRNNLYEKALEECRAAGESFRKIREDATKPPQVYVNPYVKSPVSEIDWMQRFIVGYSNTLLLSAKKSGPIEDKCRKSKCKIGQSDAPLYYDKIKEKEEGGLCYCKKGGCGKKKDPCGKKKEDPCKKKDPCGPKKKPEPCGKKKEDPCKKKKDPCGKKEDPCKKKKDPCGKKKEDPCKKKKDPCGQKKEDPCKKKDPCAKKENPCKKKEDPCKKKKDPCGKKKCSSAENATRCQSYLELNRSSAGNVKRKRSASRIRKQKVAAPQKPKETKDIFEVVDIVDPEKMALGDKISPEYKNKQYFTYSKTAFYDLDVYMKSQRSIFQNKNKGEEH